MYRQFDDGSESYEKYTVSKFVNIKKVRKFRHYSDLKKAYGSAAWHEKNDLGFDRYVYMQKAIDFTLIPIRFSAAVDSRIVEILVKDDDIVSVEEIYVMNVQRSFQIERQGVGAPHGERLEVLSGRSVTLDEIPVKYIIDVVDEKNEYKPFITTWDYEQENIEVAL